jgi:phospholipase C
MAAQKFPHPERLRRKQSRDARPQSILARLVCASVLLLSGSAFAQDAATQTPIKHVVVLFQENVSFDHYFGTYPHALNLPGEQRFDPLPGTPVVDGLTPQLLTHNPNAANPIRLSHQLAATCDMDHEYTAEQEAFDGGRMDKFVENTASPSNGCEPTLVMGYFDGNTVTALWNYAQHFAMSDRFFGTTFGPSTPGAVNLISGNAHGAVFVPPEPAIVPLPAATVIDDLDPAYDDCSDSAKPHLVMIGRNVGDLLNAKNISWGWFEGGFAPTGQRHGKAYCGAKSGGPGRVFDYVPHHEPFQYYAQTANPAHLPPSSADQVGRTDRANHQYDLAVFYAALARGHLPAISFVKAKAYEDGHAGPAYSNPVDEQRYLVHIIDAIMQSPAWRDTAIFITYDDSDGWYDHVAPPIVNGSAIPGVDAYSGRGRCGTPAPGTYPGRCGYGPRLPLLAISPYARRNYVDHRVTDQTSILRFVEDNWSLGRIGDQSFDAKAGSLDGLFDFTAPHAAAVLLHERTGAPAAP